MTCFLNLRLKKRLIFIVLVNLNSQEFSLMYYVLKIKTSEFPIL